MRLIRAIAVGLTLFGIAARCGQFSYAADSPPNIATLSVPVAGPVEIIFHGDTGPFLIQKRDTLDANAAWTDVPAAVITELQPGVFLGLLPTSKTLQDLAFYRVLSQNTGEELNGWTVLMSVSKPGNGNFFIKGESATVTVTLLDTMAQNITPASFSSLNLYMYGPQEPENTVAAVKLLNASTIRTNRVHHYINLKTDPGATLANNVITYQLQPVSDEVAGTYNVALWAVLSTDGTQQLMKFASIQLGSATIEAPVVTKTQCASCHEGPVSGKVYMHHIDPGFSPTGNWALDYQPVTSCKACHNQDGYAAYTDANGAKVPDPIVRRVHGVHRGADLKLPFNNDPVKGDFKSYVHLEFPADLRNCTKCHVDDRWKTEPSMLACGACHDNTWFGPKPVPDGWVAHKGGPQSGDDACTVCHNADKTDGQFVPSIAEVHAVLPPPIDVVDVNLTPPANGTYYVAGEKPLVTIVIRDDAGNPIDHTKVSDANFSTASLFVFGPRSKAVPVLTTAADLTNQILRASVSSTIAGPWAINGKVFKIAVNGSAPQNITITGAAAQVTPAEVAASLNAVITNLNGGAKATASATGVSMKTMTRGDNARFEIYNGDVTTAMGWKNGNVILEPDVTVAAAFTPANDLRALSDPLDFADPRVTRTAGGITYQLDDVAGVPAGTYNLFTYHVPKAGKFATVTNWTGIGHATFQVGTATAEKKVASSCIDCHGDTINHLYANGDAVARQPDAHIHAEPFDTDYCNACHDYGHPSTGDMFKNQGGTSLDGWSGFGAMPIVRRVHGVHRGAYLDHPEEVYANATKDTFGHIIFPQDIRNCTKCHSESDSWKQNPSRMACLACHDSDEAKAHATIQTWIPDPSDPYGPKTVETCEVCHGADAEFSADKVHRISNPYVPPYPRGE